MACDRKARKRSNLIAFWVSDAEKADLEARIILSGIPKGEYYRRAILGQEVNVVAGTYMSDRLAAEFKKIRECLEKELDQDEKDIQILLLSRIIGQMTEIWEEKSRKCRCCEQDTL